MAPCSVCEAVPTLIEPNSKLTCNHEFCSDCYKRYIDGSLLELRHLLRCCVCGTLTPLTREVEDEQCIHRFGRDLEPTLKEPMALFWTTSGHYIVVDANHKRVFVFNGNNRSLVDFAYIHGCTPQNGIVLTNDGHVVLPLNDGKYTNLAYYNIDGELRGTLFLKPNTFVTGMALTTSGDILVSDGPNSCVYTVNQSRQVTRTLKVGQLSEEHYKPYPYGIASTDDGGIIITDTANNRVRIYDKNAEIVDIFGTSGHRPGQFHTPTDVLVLTNGNILVSDTCNYRIQQFDHRGCFIKFVIQYKEGSDVYMAPVAMATKGTNLAVLLKGSGQAQAGEVRIYSL